MIEHTHKQQSCVLAYMFFDTAIDSRRCDLIIRSVCARTENATLTKLMVASLCMSNKFNAHTRIKVSLNTVIPSDLVRKFNIEEKMEKQKKKYPDNLFRQRKYYGQSSMHLYKMLRESNVVELFAQLKFKLQYIEKQDEAKYLLRMELDSDCKKNKRTGTLDKVEETKILKKLRSIQKTGWDDFPLEDIYPKHVFDSNMDNSSL